MPTRVPTPRFLLIALPIIIAIALSARTTDADEPPEPPQRWAVVIVGLPGDEEHVSLFEETSTTWTKWLEESLHVAPERLFVFSGEARDGLPANRRAATRESLAKTFEELAGKIRERDSLWVLALGHGHYDGRRAWLHVPGPDPEAADLARWLNALRCREQIVWLTQASSGWWMKPLARAGRIVLTATDADQEENETEFPHALATVMSAPPASLNLNADRQVSLVELFRAAVKATEARFASDERLVTEHAQLDDDANGQGTESEQLADENAAKPQAEAKSTPSPTNRPKDGREAANINLIDLPPT